jgi:hypothetical protein
MTNRRPVGSGAEAHINEKVERRRSGCAGRARLRDGPQKVSHQAGSAEFGKPFRSFENRRPRRSLLTLVDVVIGNDITRDQDPHDGYLHLSRCIDAGLVSSEA